MKGSNKSHASKLGCHGHVSLYVLFIFSVMEISRWMLERESYGLDKASS